MMEYFNHKKKAALSFVTTWMGLEGIEGIVPSEISQMEKNKCYMISHYMWTLRKTKLNEMKQIGDC